VFKKPRVSKGSIPLSIYVFLGLISADASWLRTLTAIAAAMVLLFWGSTNTASDDTDGDSWRWSEPAFKAVMTMVLLCASIVFPFLFRWLQAKPTDEQVAQDAAAIVGFLIFSFLIAAVVYLLLLLHPSREHGDPSVKVETLKLEHQACLVLFQTACTAMVIVFLTALLAPILGGRAGNAEATMARLGWAFYCFAGGIIWFLRPCLARAKYIRFEIEQIQSKAALTAHPVES
jgi:hypothetical protein